MNNKVIIFFQFYIRNYYISFFINYKNKCFKLSCSFITYYEIIIFLKRN